MSGPWMSILEYAREYNVSDMTVRRRIKTGRLNAELREGKYFIPVQDKSTNSSQQRYKQTSLPKQLKSTPPPPPVHKEYYNTEAPTRIYSASSQAQSPVEMDRLSENFEMALDHIKQREELLKANFESERERYTDRVRFLEAELKMKDKEISILKKETEDLEILIKILESKNL